MTVSKELIQKIADEIELGFVVHVNKLNLEVVSYRDNDYVDPGTWKAEISKISKNPDQYWEIDSPGIWDQVNFARAFAETVKDKSIQKKLYDALATRKAFSNFRTEVNYSGNYRQEWFKFHDKALFDFVKDQLESLLSP